MHSRRESLYHGAGLANTLELFSLPEESKAAVKDQGGSWRVFLGGCASSPGSPPRVDWLHSGQAELDMSPLGSTSWNFP